MLVEGSIVDCDADTSEKYPVLRLSHGGKDVRDGKKLESNLKFGL